MDETDQTMVNTDELAGPVAEEKSTVSGIEPRGDAAAEDSGISPFILDVANPDSCEDALEQAADAIADGVCIVLPTDTVYGIGADALNALAVQRLLNAKERGRDMPPPVLVSDSVALPALCQHIPAGAKALAEKYWPGGLTLVLRAQESLGMDLGETNGTLAVRVPDQDQTRELLRMTGPLAVSSANKSGHPAALTAQEAADQLGVEVAVYLDAGPSRWGSLRRLLILFRRRTEKWCVRAPYHWRLSTRLPLTLLGWNRRLSTKIRPKIMVLMLPRPRPHRRSQRSRADTRHA